MSAKINAIISDKENLKSWKKAYYYKRKTVKKFKLLLIGKDAF